MQPVTFLVVGAGSRGSAYSAYMAEYPEQARLVGVAEPRAFYREQLARQHQLAPAQVVADWRQLLEQPKLADAVIIATPDAQHLEPAVAFAEKGYNILLEKPLAPDAASSRRIVAAAQAHKIIFAVCHVMRYTRYTGLMKQLVDSGKIGEIVSVQHLEPVGYWHHAHSFVRGNWRNERLSSPMLLQKSCHDLDWLRYIIGQRCVEVSSFGSLMHFRRESKPAEAGEALRCLDCAHEANCAFSAPRFYLERLERGKYVWPLDVITTDFTREGVLTALREGPYGRCVYECDNDVVDHQVVNLRYERGTTASFTMIGTSEQRDRQTSIFGTRGELRGDGKRIVHYDFLSGETVEIDATDLDEASGHGGGDHGVMRSFISAVAQRDPSLILSGPEESLETHLTVFAAEQARHSRQVVQV